MSIDWSKPVRLIGRSSTANSYRVLCTDRKDNYPVVLLNEDNGCLVDVTLDGKHHMCEPIVFENIPETVEIDVWINLFQDGDHVAYASKADADSGIAAKYRFACINVKRTVEVGEGLNK